MAVKTIDLNNERLSRLKTKMLKTVLGNAFKTDATPSFNGTMYVELLGGSFESVQEKLANIAAPTDMQAILKSLCSTIDVKIDNYAAKKGYKTYYSTEADEFEEPAEDDENSDFDNDAFGGDEDTEEAKDDIAFGDADQEIEKGDNPNVDTESFDSSSSASGTISETIKELFEDLASKQADEIRNLSKTVMKLEKTNQDILLKERKAEDGEFIEDLDTPDKEEGDETSENGDTFGGEGSDDFGGDNSGTDDWGGDTSDGNGDNTDGSNPLDTPDNEGEGEQTEETTEGGGETQTNPFDNPGETSDTEGNDKALGGFEGHITDYGFLSAKILGTDNRYKPFENMSVGSVLDFAKYHANEAMKNDLTAAYSSESADALNETMSKYSKLTKILAHSTADTLAVAAYIGLPIDKDRIKYPDL